MLGVQDLDYDSLYVLYVPFYQFVSDNYYLCFMISFSVRFIFMSIFVVT